MHLNCRRCGHAFHQGARFCANCGNQRSHRWPLIMIVVMGLAVVAAFAPRASAPRDRMLSSHGQSQSIALPAITDTPSALDDLDAALAESELDRAIGILRAMLVRNPDYPYGQRLLATLLDREGETTSALAWYRTYLESNPTDSYTRLHYARSLRTQGREEDARDQLNLLRRQVPYFADPILELASLEAAAGRPENQSSLLRSAARLESENRRPARVYHAKNPDRSPP